MPAPTTPEAEPVATVTSSAPAPTNDWDVAEDSEFDTVLDAPMRVQPRGSAAPAEKTPVPSQPVVPPAATPPPSKHSPRAVRLAKHFQFTDAEIESAEPDALLRDLQAAQLERDVMTAERRATNPPVAPVVEPAPEPEWSVGLSDEEVADMHPPIVKAFRALEAEVKELRGLKKDVGEVRQHVQQQNVMTKAQRLDAMFAVKADRYGKEPMQQLRDHAQATRRSAVVNVMQQIGKHKPNTSVEDLWAEADAMLFGQSSPASAPPIAPVAPPSAAPAPPARTRGANGQYTTEEWDAAALARPTERKAEEPKGERLAIRNLNTRLIEKGFDPNNVDFNEEEASLPD